MTLHIFNPEHDIALASGLEIFTAPHAGRQLRHDLGWLPAIWADDGDVILVDDQAQAEKGLRQLQRRVFSLNAHSEQPKRSQRLTETLSAFSTDVTDINPWGWNAALRLQLKKKGIDESLLPSKEQTEAIRQLSHRRVASALLSNLIATYPQAPLIGKACECTDSKQVEALLAQWSKIVIKAPWSSSGRGLRFVNQTDGMTVSTAGWLKNMLLQQKSVMLEPYYNKVKDIAMEFISDGKGHVSYLGLSLFHTANGAYTGNLLATERQKESMLANYLPTNLLEHVRQAICHELGSVLGCNYEGPFGIDMMVVANPDATSEKSLAADIEERQFLLHPCVEINLRRTMGHVALALTRLINPQQDDERIRVMRIVYENNQYKLKIQAE